MMRTTIAVSFLALGLTGCFGLEPLAVIGDQCDINTDCQAPLVCALGRCRNECVENRDCALGLRCIPLQAPATGVCQLPHEASCTLNSECPEPTACFMPGGCLLMCVTNDDCALGEMCRNNECIAPEVPLCVYNSDCDYPYTCFREQCGQECAIDLDCQNTDGAACVPHERCTTDGIEGPCMCRVDCSADPNVCPLGTGCVTCDHADCGAVTSFCERPADAP